MSTNINFNFNFKRKYRNWDKQILPEVKKQERLHIEQGIPATIRGLLYIFESMRVLAKKDYGSLSKHLVKWREDDIISGDWIVDKSRQIIHVSQYDRKRPRILVTYNEELQTYEQFIEPYEHIKSGIDYLRDSAKDFHKYIPRWLNQPKYVEAWVEKSAMGSVIDSILNGVRNDDPNSARVIIAPNGGWSSYTFAKDNLDRLLKQKQKGKDVYIQYYGDSDPSGERMSAEDSKMVKLLTKHGVHFERIAITKQTIVDFGMQNLKEIQDPDTLDKLERDPNSGWFKEKHDGELWQIEIDALQLDLEQFRELVLSNVNKHFDKDIYKQMLRKVKTKYSKSKIKEQVKEQLEALIEELE